MEKQFYRGMSVAFFTFFIVTLLEDIGEISEPKVLTVWNAIGVVVVIVGIYALGFYSNSKD